MAVSVFDPSGMLFTKCYGYADIENAIPADTETVYEWASASKLLVWVSVMQLGYSVTDLGGKPNKGYY